MKSAVFTAIIALASSQAFAGAANTILNCKSADGKITLSGDVPGDTADFNLDVKLANGSQEIKLYSDINQQTEQQEENARIVVVDDLRKGVYTLETDGLASSSTAAGASVRLYAFPKTIQLHDLGSGNLKSSFTGRLQVYGSNMNVDQTITCTMLYQI